MKAADRKFRRRQRARENAARKLQNRVNRVLARLEGQPLPPKRPWWALQAAPYQGYNPITGEKTQ